MKALIIGFGSIGKRHFDILTKLDDIDVVDIVTKQVVDQSKSFKTLEDISDLNHYDYFIIASETAKHYSQLEYICSIVTNKKILVEKPLYEKVHPAIKTTNSIKVAYNLRFHPIFEDIKNLIKNEETYFVNVVCGQYLPTWRPEQDYRKSYSADLEQGGGVLRDLSHELDYIVWLFGEVEVIDSINSKVSDLEITSDDIFTAIGMTKNKTIFNISLDYISKIPLRRLLIHTRTKTIEADIINNTIVVGKKELDIKNIDTISVDRNYTYTKMHEMMIAGKYKNTCSFSEALKTMDIIDQVVYKEL